VTSFTTSFNHTLKEFRTPTLRVFEERGICYQLVKTCGYRKTISFRRLLSEAIFAVRLTWRGWKVVNRPSIIIAGHATLFSGIAAVLLAKRHGAPLVIDMFDLWPEVFQLAFPSKLQRFARFIFSPLYWLRHQIFRQADSVIANTRTYLNIAAGLAKNLPKDRCLLVYEGIDIKSFLQVDPAIDVHLLPRPRINESARKLRFVYGGSLGSGYDIPTVLKAAAILEQRKTPAQIVIAGDGGWRAHVEAALGSIGGNYLTYVGRLTPSELHGLYKECQAGLCTYVRDSPVAIPCKFFDYLAEGLAIVSSLRGELADLIADESLGLQYEAGSAESLADTICRITGDRKLLDSYRRNAKLAAPRFDRSVQYGKVVRLVRELLADPKETGVMKTLGLRQNRTKSPLANPPGNCSRRAMVDRGISSLQDTGENSLLLSRQSGWRLWIKSLFDHSIALCGVIVLSPLFIGISLLVWLSIGRPLLFHQQRPGRSGRPFTLLKFRTMSERRDKSGVLLPDADRLTRVGRFLRATSLDELPQLWNVLRGDISLVGPRPLLMEYLSRYSPEQARRHDVLPGITGWAQINGRNALSWEEKFSLDVWYVENWSLMLDFKILANTLRRVVQRDGISNQGHATMPEFISSGK